MNKIVLSLKQPIHDTINYTSYYSTTLWDSLIYDLTNDYRVWYCIIVQCVVRRDVV
jgi:hypothetical protein